MYLGGVLTNKMIDGFNMRKSIMIITEKPEAIADAIMIELDRGVTFFMDRVHILRIIVKSFM